MVPAWLVDEIESRGGFISIHDYMSVCLYHPVHGYYSRGDNFTEKFGRDFVTAPMLSPIFASAIAHWVEKTWRDLGSPSRFILAEAGPGDGTLIFHTLNNLSKNIRSSCEVLMIETSPVLTAMQQGKLRGKKVRWVTELAAQDAPVILVANELLDAFPVHQFAFKNGDWMERGFDGELNPAMQKVGVDPGLRRDEATVGEISPEMDAWLLKLRDTASAALLIDYGYVEGSGDSVQAMRGHRPVALTHEPGASDITAHVNFAQAVRTLQGSSRVTDLAEFLLSNKILDAAEATINDESTAATLHRLLHPTRMGALFKVLEYRQK
jgi:SAM-dependent MidA family methyltransferase